MRAVLDISNISFTNPDCLVHIDEYYSMFFKSFKSGTEICEYKTVKNFKPVPGWNQICKIKYQKAHDAMLFFSGFSLEK